ncbi:rhodanese-like domain-containing protein [Candidatus Tisiphia endosymbiont of Nemotelus uliginosus]|uniref:rhodanese-like domain-containing protein n=1 Tax=Candidatus Tisiphia endosymbiont of Nemotelus uliginosus TaxID=3077926 RepID=UPI0035C9259E
MNIKNMSSLKAYEMIKIDNKAIMIDVRTSNEWQKVGVPQLPKHQLIFLSWRLLPGMLLNNHFTKQLMLHINNIDNNILFLCRSGARSYEAASLISHLGYTCYNIIDGFEGGVNGIGWQKNNLPWQIL